MFNEDSGTSGFDFAHRARPALKWAGGKSALIPQLLALFPKKFDRYVEPFLGGGALFLSLRPGSSAMVNDSNPELINLYRVIREKPAPLMKALDALSRRYCEKYYYELRKTLPRGAVAKAARTIFLNKTGYNGLYRQNQKGGFNVPFGKRAQCPALYDRKNLLAISERLKFTELLNEDFSHVLGQCGKGDLVYCDPPYEPLSSTSSFNSYTKRGFSQLEQRRLQEGCAAAAKRGAHVLISNSSAPFILNLYREWDVQPISARRAINSKASARGAISEVCIVRVPQKPSTPWIAPLASLNRLQRIVRRLILSNL